MYLFIGGFLVGCIVSSLAFKYLILDPYRRNTLRHLEKMNALLQLLKLAIQQSNEPIISPIQKIREGS